MTNDEQRMIAEIEREMAELDLALDSPPPAPHLPAADDSADRCNGIVRREPQQASYVRRKTGMTIGKENLPPHVDAAAATMPRAKAPGGLAHHFRQQFSHRTKQFTQFGHQFSDYTTLQSS